MTLSQTFASCLKKLESGNELFLEQLHHKKQLAVTLNPDNLGKAQKPFGIVVTCSDSRVIPELIFGQGFGDLFVVRLAGSTIDSLALASIEYAALSLGVSLCVILGHSMCGAIQAAADFMKTQTSHPSAHLRELVTQILLPSLGKGCKVKEQQNNNLQHNLLLQHLDTTVNRVQTKSPILGKLIKENKFFVTSALYDLQTGKVTFA